ncbi:MAG: hypothetical protein LBJ87_07025 [bacterium]|nr:hypothetical protein [bacterium]
MSSETERLAELLGEVGHRLGGALGEFVPPEAHRHLLNAQRELLTALFLIYEHQVGARRDGAPEEPAENGAPAPRPRRRRSTAARRRVTRIDVD